MLGATFFNHQQIKRYLIAFGSFFNTIEISREDATGTEVQRLVVPLEYGNKDQWEARLVQDPEFLKGVGVTVPRIAFELVTTTYDGARKINSLDVMTYPTSAQQTLSRLYVGVPYTLGFTLDILTKTQNDAHQILEQILPFFTPDLTFRVVPVEELGFPDQVPLTLTSVTHTDNFDGPWVTRRAIIWSMSFSMKVNFYGPVKAASRIQEVIIDLYNSPIANLLDPVSVITEDETETFFDLEQQPANVDEFLTLPVEPQLNTIIDTLIDDGHILGEQTPNAFTLTGPVSSITATANASGGVTVTIADNVDEED